MNENDNQELDLTKDEEVEDTTEEESPTTDDDSVDYKALYEEEAAKAKKLKRKLYTKEPTSITKSKSEEQDELSKTVKRLEMIENKRQFGFEHGLSPEETDAVFKFSNGKPTKETLDHPFVKAGIESIRASKRIEANTPSSSQRSSPFAGKQFKEMSEEDRAKAFESKMASIK